MIKPDSIEGLKNNLDIVDVLSGYLDLKKNGANFKALCPFHDEKSPSLIISPAKQIFHCFGCHAGGDSIKFVMEYEKINYVQALEKLAEENNFTLEYDKNDFYNKNNNSQNSFDLLREFMIFTQSCLNNNEKVRTYLKDRGIYESSIEKFEIGYAPSSSQVMGFLRNKTILEVDAFNAGILTKGDNGFYPRFIERILFPIYSNTLKVVGFGGRTITNHPAKYINSSTNLIFNKSKTLYGLHITKDDIYKKKELIVTEGYLDVIMLYQAGFKNVIATLGTALTNEHSLMIKKFSNNVIIAYDGDNAGKLASYKAGELLLSKDINVKIASFNENEDPADLVASHKLDTLKTIFNKSKTAIEYIIDYKANQYSLDIAEEKQKAYDDIMEFTRSIGDITKEEYKNYIANTLSINESLVKFPKYKKIEKTPIKKPLPTENLQELELIKTILEYPSLLGVVINSLDTIHFDVHKQEFEALKENDFSNENLVAINFRDDIKHFNEEQLKEQIIIFLKKFYKRLLEHDLKNNISSEEKFYVIRNIREQLNSLKQNKILPFNEAIMNYF
jgi:DNA primase